MFFKASTTVADHDSDVVIPAVAQDDQADYEGELVRFPRLLACPKKYLLTELL